MKHSTLLAVAVALAVSLAAGCRNTPPRTTVLPGGPGGSDPGANARARPLDLSAPPVGIGDATEGTAGGLVSTDLPDHDKLRDRDHDRATFANQTVLFEFDRANVKSGEASKVDQVARQFKALSPGHDLLIEGHCDERGTEEYNRSLGERRALALRELLMNAGIDGGRIYTRSLGKDEPAVLGHDETAWSRNRRGEFILVLPSKISTTQNTQ